MVVFKAINQISKRKDSQNTALLAGLPLSRATVWVSK